MIPVAPEAIALIKSFEGKRLRGYKDPIGIPTIGYGHTAMAGGDIRYSDGVVSQHVRVGCEITEAEADRLKARDLASFAAKVDPLFPADVTPLERGACLSLAFNIGPDAFRRSSVMRHLKGGNRAKAAGSFLAWNKAGGKVLPGLTRRRQAEAALFLGKVAEASRITGADLTPRTTAPTTPRAAPSPVTPAAFPPPPDIPKPLPPASAPRMGILQRFLAALRGS